MRTIINIFCVLGLVFIAPVSQVLAQAQVQARAAESSMADFAYGVELTSADSSMRRFSLTPLMLRDVQRRDLGDVRVFDYYNNAMPMRLEQPGQGIKTWRQTLGVKKYYSGGEVKGFILERPKKHALWLKSLHLKWRNGAAPKVLVLRIEHSSDRKNWKLLKPSEVVSNYRFGNTTLDHNVIDINSHTERFLRLVFAHKKHVAPVLRAADSYVTSSQLPEPKWITTGKLEPVEDMPGRYTFSTGASLVPVLMNLHFDKLNTVVSGSLYMNSGSADKPAWKLVNKNYSSYKVTLNNKVVRSKPIRLDRYDATRWMLVTAADVVIPEHELPDVMVAYQDYEVVFAAEGYEPYTLVWGSDNAQPPVPAELATSDNVDKVYRGRFMNRDELGEVVASRQQMLALTIAGMVVLLMVIIGAVVYYRRSRTR